jgi:hypothetical protein
MAPAKLRIRLRRLLLQAGTALLACAAAGGGLVAQEAAALAEDSVSDRDAEAVRQAGPAGGARDAVRTVPRLAPGFPDDRRQNGPRTSPLFLASAVLPGAAQFLMGEDRWVPYVAVEAWALISYQQQRRLARSLERRYRDVAWQVARRVSVGERRDTVFEYYEAMAQYNSSGGWMPDGGPERQAGTFNGDLWRLAQALYLPSGQPAPPGSAAYDAAVAYYLARAIPPGYSWAWGVNFLEQEVFADLISESDAAFRSAGRYVGVILANHVTSAVEAFISARLRQLAGEAVRIEGGPVRPADGGGWEYGVRIRF